MDGRHDGPQALLLRDREAAHLLGVSRSQVHVWVRAGLLTAIRLPGLRAIRFSRRQIDQLVSRWEAEAVQGTSDAQRRQEPDVVAHVRARCDATGAHRHDKHIT